MELHARICRLERARPERLPNLLGLDLPRGICTQIVAAMAAGTYPKSLCDADLEAIVKAADLSTGLA